MPSVEALIAAAGAASLGEVFGFLGSLASIFSLFWAQKVVRVVRTLDSCVKELSEAYFCFRTFVVPPSTNLALTSTPQRAFDGRDLQRVCDARTDLKRLLEATTGVTLDHDDNHFLEIATGLQRRGEAKTAAWLYQRARKLHEQDQALSDEERRRCFAGLESCFCALWEIEKVLALRRVDQAQAEGERCLAPIPVGALAYLDLYSKCLTTSLGSFFRVCRLMMQGEGDTVLVISRR